MGLLNDELQNYMDKSKFKSNISIKKEKENNKEKSFINNIDSYENIKKIVMENKNLKKK